MYIVYLSTLLQTTQDITLHVILVPGNEEMYILKKRKHTNIKSTCYLPDKGPAETKIETFVTRQVFLHPGQHLYVLNLPGWNLTYTHYIVTAEQD